MHRQILDLLACPACGSDISLKDASHELDQLETGTLDCMRCPSSYPIVAGIPRMVPDLEKHAIGQSFVEEFGLVTGDEDLDPYELRRYFFFARTGIDPVVYEKLPGNPYRTSLPSGAYVPDPSFLSGMVILDAGCGPGRFTEVAAREGGRHVIGLELGSHVDRAARRCRNLENTDFVQGSIFFPPFKEEAFDFVFSLGVLHHTPDPEGGFRILSKLVKRTGAISVWLYSHAYWGDRLRGAIARRIHRVMSRISSRDAYRLARWVLYPLGLVQMYVARIRALKWVFAPLFLITVPRHPSRQVMLTTILDYYTPRFISTHKPEDVAEWAAEAGFREVTVLPFDASIHARERASVSDAGTN